MSASGTSGHYPNRTQPCSDQDRKAQPIAAKVPGFPPDPLLKSGSSIGATTNGQSSVDDRKAEPRKSSNGGAACPDNTNGAEPATTTSSVRGIRKQPEPEIDWLPPGWTVEDRVRVSGASAGTTDRYYFDPISNRKFRSKKEVLYFLQTGTRLKRKKEFDADAPSGDNSGAHKQKACTIEKGSARNFNFSDVPENVQWVLSDSSEEWKAFIGNDQVLESSKRDWLAAFTLLASRDRGRYQ
ncbi:methyl-CpG-binding domain-containing protein 5-like [Humulus lupulus]|uniref:methyl-CpG-binding domain-containing protein 5-like n=1 Tax=Humulus lupulus TaxID=3486 RepID=UPI002B4018FA|nr:methyl-CpG-binding domain-containing protein 5-like [Humulus lupulus]